MISASPESTSGNRQARIVHVLDVDIEIGGMPIRVHAGNPEFAELLEARYAGFVTPAGESHPMVELEIDLAASSGAITAEEDVSVRLESGGWVMERGDFRATWDADLRRGRVRQRPNPYAIDAVLRILHSLFLAREGGFLVHAASAIRNGRAYLFAGVSGTGKTTISRLAPPDVTVLTDEISYVRKVDSRESTVYRPKAAAGGGQEAVDSRQSAADSRQSINESRHPSFVTRHSDSPVASRHSYVAFGTPFAGELARVGENTQAPLAALHLLAQGPENRIEPVSETEAARALLRNILFFAEDSDLVQQVFDSALEFVRHVPVQKLVFTPDAGVWELIG
jgi:hypothetical protein